jgi:basic amino acid/polyamine antiporter, APA family
VRSVQQPNADQSLVRGIGPWALTAFAINLTVGAGILGLPARIQALVGNYSVLILVLCGFLIALIALCFAEIGSRFDRSGGPQLYASIALGPATGFTVGWLLWISRLGTCGAVSNLLVDYGTTLWPPLAQPIAGASAISALVLAYTWVNIRGIRQTAAVSTAFTVFKLIPLVVFAGVGLFFVDPHSLHLGPLPSATNASTAILLASFAFFGFDATTVMAGEVRNARTSIPFAILLSVACVVVLYALIQFVCAGTLADPASSERPLADAATLFVGPWGAIAIAVAAAVSCAGVFGASFTPATRLLFAMSDQRQLPAALARVHARFHTPILAIALTAGTAWVLALSGSFIYLVKLTLITRVTVYAITCAMLGIFRRASHAPEPSFKVPAGEAVAYGTAVLCILFLASSSMRELLDVAIAAAIGLVVFGVTRFRLARAGADLHRI